MSRHEERVAALKERKFNSWFSEARRSLVNLFTYQTKTNDISSLGEAVFKKALKEYGFNTDIKLSDRTASLIAFEYIDKSQAGKLIVDVKVQNVEVTQKRISFEIEAVAQRKLVSSQYVFELKGKKTFIHYVEHTLSDTPWDNIQGRVTRFYYIRELKKRQKLFVKFLNEENFKTKRSFSLIKQLSKLKGFI